MDYSHVAMAVNSEKCSMSYAKQFFDAEPDLREMHRLDTSLLDEVFQSPCKLLDATMGPGRHVHYFAKKGYAIDGNDYNPHMVSEARKSLKADKLDAGLFNLDVTNLESIRDYQYDGVISMGCSLGCIPKRKNRQKAVNEFARVVNQGGMVVVHFHNLYSLTFNDLWTILFFLKNRGKGFELGDSLFYHSKELGNSFTHIFTFSEAKEIMQGAGLTIENVYRLNRDQTGMKPWYLPGFMCGGFIVVAKKGNNQSPSVPPCLKFV